MGAGTVIHWSRRGDMIQKCWKTSKTLNFWFAETRLSSIANISGSYEFSVAWQEKFFLKPDKWLVYIGKKSKTKFLFLFNKSRFCFCRFDAGRISSIYKYEPCFWKTYFCAVQWAKRSENWKLINNMRCFYFFGSLEPPFLSRVPLQQSTIKIIVLEKMDLPAHMPRSLAVWTVKRGNFSLSRTIIVISYTIFNAAAIRAAVYVSQHQLFTGAQLEYDCRERGGCSGDRYKPCCANSCASIKIEKTFVELI